MNLREKALHDEALLGKPASCHTPGPWRTVLRSDGLVNVYAGATDVTLCARPHDGALIAAAPDLYDAVLDARNLLEDPDAESFDADDLLDKLNALLKRLDT